MDILKKHISIRYQLLLFFLVIGLVTIAIISLYNYYRSEEAILARTFEQLTSVRVVKTRQIESFYNDRKQEAKLVSNSFRQFKSLSFSELEAYIANNDIVEYIASSGYYAAIHIFDTTGSSFEFDLKDSVFTFSETNDDAFNGMLDTAMRKQEVAITDFQIGTGDINFPVQFVMAPIFNEDADIQGFVSLAIPLDVINKIMLERSPSSGLGESGESYLVGSDFLMRSTSRFRENSVLHTFVKTDCTKDANKGNSGMDIIFDYRGIKVLSSYSPLEIEGLKWIILAEIDFKEAMIPIVKIRNDILFMSILLAVIIIGLSFVLSNRIVQPVLKLKDAAVKMEQGEYSAPIEIKSKDELGALVSAFNSMAEHIGCQTKELLEREERLRHFYEATNDGIFLHISGTPVLVNKALTNLTGFTETELMQAKLDDIIHCKSEKDKTSYETIAYKKDHTVFPVEIQQSTIEFKGKSIKACVIRDISRRRKIEKELQGERKKRISAVFGGQEIERQRLSRELHDSLGQKLIAMKLNIESLASKIEYQNNKKIEFIANQLNETIQEVRQISSNLMPPVLNEFGLETALKQLCNEFSAGNEQINFDFQGEKLNLKSKQMIYIYRIAQEAINNTIKHASAKAINVQLLKKEKSLVLIIEDDGMGFSLKEKAGTNGNGIYNMRERVNLLNGRFQLISEKGKGTLINVRIPVEK